MMGFFSNKAGENFNLAKFSQTWESDFKLILSHENLWPSSLMFHF